MAQLNNLRFLLLTEHYKITTQTTQVRTAALDNHVYPLWFLSPPMFYLMTLLRLLIWLSPFFPIQLIHHNLHMPRFHTSYNDRLHIFSELTRSRILLIVHWLILFVFLLAVVKALLPGQGDLSDSQKHCRKALSPADQGDAFRLLLPLFYLILFFYLSACEWSVFYQCLLTPPLIFLWFAYSHP